MAVVTTAALSISISIRHHASIGFATNSSKIFIVLGFDDQTTNNGVEILVRMNLRNDIHFFHQVSRYTGLKD
jgi:hypothetical protein